MSPVDVYERSAVFSPDRMFRYGLWRWWGPKEKGYVMFIGLNPSTADENLDDPTVRRCITYARDWGYAGLCMTNIFAFRQTDPAKMKAYPEPVGPGNDAALLQYAKDAGVVVAAWGVHGVHLDRAEHVKALLPSLHCLSKTKQGHPGHPLYLKKSLVPMPF